MIYVNCSSCDAKCCKHSFTKVEGKDVIGSLLPFEYEKFPRKDVLIKIKDMYWLPLVDDKCPLLTDDNKCSIYIQRPEFCKIFSCKTKEDLWQK